MIEYLSINSLRYKLVSNSKVTNWNHVQTKLDEKVLDTQFKIKEYQNPQLRVDQYSKGDGK